jgi:hypothetical protein
MSFIHYLLLGHFDRDDNVVRFAKRSEGAPFEPVLSNPIASATLRSILRAMLGGEGATLPPYWPIWEKDGYLICEKYTRNSEMVDFATRVVNRTGCEIYDVAAHRDISLDSWLAAIREYST